MDDQLSVTTRIFIINQSTLADAKILKSNYRQLASGATDDSKREEFKFLRDQADSRIYMLQTET